MKVDVGFSNFNSLLQEYANNSQKKDEGLGFRVYN
jgi:hypothetical protein